MNVQRLIGLGNYPNEIAWRLVETIFAQRAAMVVGALCCATVGAAGFVGTGSIWYLVGLVYTLAVASWRLAQVLAFERNRGSNTPVGWAFRNLLSASATAIGWAGWALTMIFEPQTALVAIVLGLHAGLITGGAVRNNAVKVVATAQTVIASPPLFVACVVSPSPYFHVYAFIVAIHFLAALTLVKFLHEQTVRILLSEQQAHELAGKLAIANDELALVNEHLEEQVGLDPLTALPNRRAFDLVAAREWRNAARENTSIAVLMIDVDHFKLFNDHYGHQAGDDCLRVVAATMAAVLRRPGDVLARYGGEEFIALLPSTSLEGALQTAERMVAELADRAVPHAASSLQHVSVSIGLACTDTTKTLSLKQLVALADRALYAAKRGGRNCIQAHEEQTPLSMTAA